MPAENSENYTTKFKVDISDLKNNIKTANAQIKTYAAEIKNASAGMKKGEETADSLTKKIDAQQKIVDSEKAKLQAIREQLERYNTKATEGEKVVAELTEKHRKAAKEYGENSEQVKALSKQLQDAQAAQERNKTAVQQLNTQIINQDTAVKNAEAALGTYQNKLKDVTGQNDTLTDKVKKQETELQELKQKYINVSAEQGATSDESKELARQIDALSTELKTNRDKMTEAEKAADELDNSLEKVGDEADNTTAGGLSAFGVALGNLAANIISKAVQKLKELVAQTIETGKAFDTSMSKVAAISGATGDELQALRDKAKEMGSTTAFTATQSSEAFQYMAMAGWKTEDMLNGIEGVMNLAAASGEDLATTSDIVTDALTAMGYSAGDAGQLADVMAAASSNANTNVALMGSTFQYAAPIVGALGYSMEDTAVAIGLMANAGIKGDKAGTALRSVLTRLSAPPKECAIEMEKLGISLTDSEGKMKTLDEIMQELRIAFNSLSETEQTAVAKHIAGANAMSGLLAIVNAAPEDFEKLTSAVANSEGAAESMSKTMRDNLGGDMTLLSSKLEGIELAVYEKLEPALRKGAEMLDKLLDMFSYIVEHGGETIATITGIAAAFAAWKFVGLITAVTTALKGMTIAEMAAAAKTWLLNTALLANPIGLLIAALAGLVAAFVVLWNKCDWFREFWINAWEKIKEAAGVAWEKIQEFFVTAWDKIQEVWGAVSKWFNEEIIQPVKKFFSDLWEFIKTKASATWNNIKLIWSVVSSWFKGTIIDPVTKWFTGMWDGLKDGASKAWEGIKNVFSPVADWFKQKFKKAWENVKTVFSTGGKVFEGIKDGIADAFKTVVNAIIRGINNVIAIPFKAINDALDTIRSINIAGIQPFEGLISRFDIPQIPELAKGGIVDGARKVIVGEKGKEAIIPLENNQRGLKEIAALLLREMPAVNGGNNSLSNVTYNFNQTNNSPTALSRWEIYRQTKNLISAMQGV
jgi:TP901 family phage tail tape measure protein